MKTIKIIEQLHYPEPILESTQDHHKVVCEIATRLQELDELVPGDAYALPGGIRVLTRLSSLCRQSRRAYRLVLDILGEQKSLSMSLHDLANGHLNKQGEPSKRQAWLQNNQRDLQLINDIWPEVGVVLSDVMKRRLKNDDSMNDDDADDQ